MYLYSSLLDDDSDMGARSHPNLPLQPRMGYSTSLGLGKLRRRTFWPLLHIGLESVWSRYVIFKMNAHNYGFFMSILKYDRPTKFPRSRILISGGRSYILTASVCCVFLPTVVIIGSHVAMIIHIRRASQLQTSKRSGRQARKLEILLLRVRSLMNICDSIIKFTQGSCNRYLLECPLDL